jgi:hypothetical protein
VAAGTSPAPIGEAGLAAAEGCLGDLEVALKRRGLSLDTYDAIKCAYAEIAYPMEKVKDWLNGEPSIDPKAVDIFVWYLRRGFAELRQIADEIDAEYARA